jgi:phosphonoacetaldehyde hydrolase
MSMIKAVVFDWAGTMVDFGCQAPVEALIEAFGAEGVSLSGEDARRDMGRAKRDHVAALLAYPPVAQAWAQAKGAAPAEPDVERVYRALEPLMAQAAARFSDLIPGAAAVAVGLRAQGVRVGSGTGYTRQMMSEILRRAASQGYSPEVVVCAGETPSGRPSPLMLWQALVQLDAWPANLCVKVDDAEVGIEEGCAAGCWSVGVAASGNGVGLSLEAFKALGEEERRARIARSAQSLKAAGAHLLIDTVADLPAALTEIERRIAAGQGPTDD